MKRNPTYKGKWYSPLIDNPNYHGIWKSREIPDPNYFELESPNFESVAGIGIEIWTMHDGIFFDNMLIASDEKTAERFGHRFVKAQAEESQSNIVGAADAGNSNDEKSGEKEEENEKGEAAAPRPRSTRRVKKCSIHLQCLFLMLVYEAVG
ncbi:hypothetical protein Dimus_008698 [Dionaea muscipula]